VRLIAEALKAQDPGKYAAMTEDMLLAAAVSAGLANNVLRRICPKPEELEQR
jgi:hypothetical protein